jgi:hypothetical protein
MTTAGGESVWDAAFEEPRTAFVATIQPGTYEIGCGGAPVAFEVVDPNGLYVSGDLACGDAGNSGTVGAIDYAPGALGMRGSPVQVARKALRGLRAGDLVERAGYPETTETSAVRVVRESRTVAVLGFETDGHEGWLLTSTQACHSTGLVADPAA